MTFSRRLRFYLIGVSLGILAIAVLFGPRAFSCSYFPNARVLEEARSKPMFVKNQVQEVFDEQNIDSVFLYNELLKRSKITNFNTAEMRSRPCRIYRTEYNKGSQQYKLKFSLCKEKVVLEEILVE